MDKSIENQNRNFVIDWIKLNPNFSNLNFYNNSILFSNGTKLNLNNFLISSLLENPIISSNIYSMDEYLFYKIVCANTEIYNFYCLYDDNEPEYIEGIKLTTKGTAYIITNKNRKNPETNEIKDATQIEVINAYRILKDEKTNKFITIDDLYKKLNITRISNNKKDILFFDLINSNEKLDSNQIEYVNRFSKYMYTLTCYQDYLIGDAKKCLNLYNYKMNYLLGLDETNENQKMALNLYNDNIKSYDLKQKEAYHEVNASVGFSSLALIIVSVVVTLSLITLLIIIY